MSQKLPAGVTVPEDIRPQIDEAAPLIVQIQDLAFYYRWINSRPWTPTQDDLDYYREHMHRLEPLESAWRSKRREHMLAQAKPFLEWVNPIHKKMSIQMPDVFEDLYPLLDIYDSACTFYVELDFCKWTDSQAVRAENAIRKFIQEKVL